MARTGYPTSANGASSFHLHWRPAVELVSAEVTITVPDPPAVPDLFFWALQVNFSGPDGPSGGAHLGLQWHTGHPGGTAVNWGGYRPDGSLLAGTESLLPSAQGNPHTRDYQWRPGARYRLRVAPDPDLAPGWWAGSVTEMETGVVTVVRSLQGGGDRLVGAMVWTEAFCRCEASPAAAIWSEPRGSLKNGDVYRPQSAELTFQSEADGGCDNTAVYGLPHGLAQVTGVTRTHPRGALVDWPI